MKHVFFGLGTNYSGGAVPSVGLNRHGVVAEVHRQEVGSKLFCSVGRLSQATIDWENAEEYGTGDLPRVALNGNNVVVAVHQPWQGLGQALKFNVGRVEGNRIQWITKVDDYDRGRRPGVALNDDGIALEVHQAWGKRDAWYSVWRVQGQQLTRLDKGPYGWGYFPRVALNNKRQVVEVHYADTDMWYRVGGIRANRLGFDGTFPLGKGIHPSVALTDEGLVIVTFEGVRSTSRGWQRTRVLHQWTGQLAGNRIDWAGVPVRYDAGDDTSVAAAGTMSVEVHEGTILKTLWSSTSVITDRAGWMQNRLATLGRKPLRDLVLPASHDAGMYFTRSGIAEPWARTQDLPIYGQLSYGIRYFDLRVRWLNGKFVIKHGNWNGPDLSEVLGDLRKFALENRKELAILKFSAFSNIDNTRYAALVEQIRASIGTWLVTSIPDGKRLADVTLNEYVANGPAYLVVVDENYAIDVKRDGFWVYRNWNAIPVDGDLRVFDQYSDTEIYKDMRDNQFLKFRAYDGWMALKLPCDLFLLSWTLTPSITPVRTLAATPNRNLGAEIQFGKTDPIAIPNVHGKIMNLLYVDFVELARVTDVALFHNERVTRVARAKPVRRSVKAGTSSKARISVKAEPAVPSTAASDTPRLSIKAKPSAKARTSVGAKPSAKAKGSKART